MIWSTACRRVKDRSQIQRDKLFLVSMFVQLLIIELTFTPILFIVIFKNYSLKLFIILEVKIKLINFSIFFIIIVLEDYSNFIISFFKCVVFPPCENGWIVGFLFYSATPSFTFSRLISRKLIIHVYNFALNSLCF